MLALLGWRIEGAIPNLAKAVVIAAPHSSNWDFVVGIALVFATGVRIGWIGKIELFRWPFGPVMRWLGGVPVDRRATQGFVEQIAETFRRHDRLFLAVAPAGTRRPGVPWKSGFYYMALRAKVPILPGFFDYSRKRLGFLPPFVPTGDVEADLDRLRAAYLPFKRRDEARPS